jgi:solute carrier family 35 protein
LLPVGLSCLFGLSISFFGLSCRKVVSVTGLTGLGNVNKILTVVINLVIWDNHATFIGTIGLLICMLGGIFFFINSQWLSLHPLLLSLPQMMMRNSF